MIKINLLDWRAAQRERNKREFYVWLAGAAIIGILIVYLGNHSMVGAIHYQESRNHYLQNQIQIADNKIKKIKNIKKVRKRLEHHIRIIGNLQESRTRIVHYFDTLASTLPDGIYITQLKQRGEATTVNGKAQSNGAISNYLRNLDHSDWFADPNLIVISTNNGDKGSRGVRHSSFTLTVKATTPSKSGKKEASKDKQDNRRQS